MRGNALVILIDLEKFAVPFCPGNVTTTACDRGTVLRD